MSDNSFRESQSVQTYLNMIQSVISRMASNSASCKTWFITLISAIILLIAEKQKYDLLWVCYVPLVMFAFLDSYYLQLEKQFRGIFEKFVETFQPEMLFSFKIDSGFISSIQKTFWAFWSFSIFPFYLSIAATLALAINLLGPVTR